MKLVLNLQALMQLLWKPLQLLSLHLHRRV
jgi:hypothetical protein